MFQDRLDAGRKLATRLASFRNRDVVVLGIPRGGVIVAKPIADSLCAPLGVLIVRKIGVPGQEELAVGAVSADEKPVWNDEILNSANLSPEDLAPLVEKKIQEVRERKKIFDIKPVSVRNKTVVLTDDGIATGATFEAAHYWLKRQQPKKIIAALPCAPTDTADRLRAKVDHFACLEESSFFSAVGRLYRDFGEVTDGDVRQILKSAPGYSLKII